MNINEQRTLTSSAALALGIAVLASPANAAFSVAPNTAIGLYETMDAKLTCGKVGTSGYGDGYAFVRNQAGTGQIAVTKYATTATGVTSTSMGGGTHILPGSLNAFSVTSVAPFNSGSGDDTIYMFGGVKPGPTYSNSWYKYKPSGFLAGFSTPTAMGSIPARAGIAAVPINATEILLIGGYDASGARSEVYKFDVGTGTFSAPLAPLPAPLQNAKTIISGTDPDRWIYVVGGDATVNSASNGNRFIYRYSVQSNTWITLKDSAGNPLQLPTTATRGQQLAASSVQGAMLILVQSGFSGPGNGQEMTAFRFTHPTDPATGNGATLTTRVYNVPTRSRDGFGLLRCSPDAWVIGGTNGHGPSFQNRGNYVDKLTRY